MADRGLDMRAIIITAPVAVFESESPLMFYILRGVKEVITN